MKVIFVHCRMYYSGGSWHKPQNSHAALLDKYWTKLQMGNMTREELKKVSVTNIFVHDISGQYAIICYPNCILFFTSFPFLCKILLQKLKSYFLILCCWFNIWVYNFCDHRISVIYSQFTPSLCIQVLISRYPRLTVVTDRLLDIYCQLTGERHSDSDTSILQSPDDTQQHKSENKSTLLDGRALSLRSGPAHYFLCSLFTLCVSHFK